MNNRTRSVFKVIAGGYLVYLGGTLFLDVLKSKPNNYVLFLIAGVFFIAMGGYLAVINLKGMMTPEESDEELIDQGDEDENSDSTVDKINEAPKEITEANTEVDTEADKEADATDSKVADSSKEE
ncbi:MAG: hypothetical protein PHX08_14420 [Lachnospiraceae bacterium]|nr:hypothetical protein [Lachnospiraceae bacterium]